MTHILRPSQHLPAAEIMAVLRERPGLLNAGIRFLQGPFPIPGGGTLDLLGLDEHGAWVVVVFAPRADAQVLGAVLGHAAWVRKHAAWITAMPAFGGADAGLMTSVYIVAKEAGEGLQDILAYIKDVSVQCIKIQAFDIGDQQGLYFEPMQAPQGQAAQPAVAATQPDAAMAQDIPAPPPDEPNIALLQPLTDEEIAEFLPQGDGKEKMA